MAYKYCEYCCTGLEKHAKSCHKCGAPKSKEVFTYSYCAHCGKETGSEMPYCDDCKELKEKRVEEIKNTPKKVITSTRQEPLISHCTYCGKQLEVRIVDTEYDAETGSPIYLYELACPRWFGRYALLDFYNGWDHTHRSVKKN